MNKTPDDDLENHVIEICKNSNIIINPADIKACHRLPLRRNNATDNKRVIVKFVNMKHSKLMLRSKKSISYTLIIRYVLITVVFGKNAKICKGKAK